jgi:hypothetical protein
MSAISCSLQGHDLRGVLDQPVGQQCGFNSPKHVCPVGQQFGFTTPLFGAHATGASAGQVVPGIARGQPPP